MRGFAIPERLKGRYRIEERVGAGATAIVHRAVDEGNKRICAIKMLMPKARRHDTVRARFAREARVMARLNHRGVVVVYDVGIEGEIEFIVQEYMAGGTLWDRVARHGPLDRDAGLYYMARVLEVLAFAHENGVVHRDIKAKNMLLDERGFLKLGDFGIARKLDTAHDLTLPGQRLGTLTYCAPEQLTDATNAGPRADLYGVGAVFTALMTGQTPHALLVPEKRDEIFAPFGRDLGAVLRRATRYHPEDRWRSANEMLLAVQHLRRTERSRGERVTI